ncbi:hypothetical protein DOJK_00750 [Patescibacteria group bacterium]|nr:hypothetical protein DOJK_00750 [Patescibacteria group bacterium]
MNCNNPKQISGFTLLELMIVVSLAGVLMALAVPSFRDMIRNTRLTTYANEFVTALNLARSESIKRGVTVSIRKNDKVTGCTPTYWSTCGWNVFVDNDADGTLDTGEEVIRTYNALPNGYTLVGSNINITNYLSYKSDGMTNVPEPGFILCDNRDGNNTIEPYTAKIIYIKVGRIRMAKDTTGDGIPENSSNVNVTSCGL